jgi:hypothetical protein
MGRLDPHVRGSALKYLQSQRRSGGGWAPVAEVGESTWVTALMILVLTRLDAIQRNDPGIVWLLKSSGLESSWTNRLRRWMMGGDTREISRQGWPWYPGASAWISPTAMTILALERVAVETPGIGIRQRIAEGRRFLLSRRCSDGGWNHGSSRALGYESPSYPETTGMALLALRGASEQLDKSQQTALRQLPASRSIEGWSWLQMGLRAQKVPVGDINPPAASPDSTMDNALFLLASAAMAGKGVL